MRSPLGNKEERKEDLPRQTFVLSKEDKEEIDEEELRRRAIALSLED